MSWQYVVIIAANLVTIVALLLSIRWSRQATWNWQKAERSWNEAAANWQKVAENQRRLR